MGSRLLGCVVPLIALAAEAAVAQQYVISTVAGGGPTPTPVPAVSAAVTPVGVAADSSGNIYFSSSGLDGSPKSVFRMDTNGGLARLAGNGREGFLGDGGPALNAELSLPGLIALSRSGDLYIVESMDNRIRKVSAAGIITSIAGTSGYNGYSGDGGPASEAMLSLPSGLAVDAAGNVYFTDSGNHRIRRISPDGTIQTIAGNGSSGNTGDGGPALQAAIGLSLTSLGGVALDANGALYFTVDSLIRRVSANGIITTVAGTGVPGTAGDGGPALSAQLLYPSGLAFDGAGNLYISGGSEVRKVSAAGIITTVAGTSVSGFSGDGGLANRAQLNGALGVAVDGGGNLFIADVGNNRLRRVSPSGTISTVAGNGLRIYLGEGGPATAAQLDGPMFVTVDGGNNLLISDYDGQMIRKVSATGIITTVAGIGGPVITRAVRDGQTAISAQIGRPAGLAADPKGNVFVSDSDNACVWKIGTDGLITRVAGNFNLAYSGDGGLAVNAGFITPWGLALDNAGNLYIADENSRRIRKVSTTGIIQTVAGNGAAGFSGDGGPATMASLNSPQSVAVDANGNLYITDFANARIRKVSPDGIISTVAGNGSIGYAVDGVPATRSPLSLPFGLTLDPGGNLYFSDGLVHKVSPDGILTTIAGNLAISNQIGYSGDGGPATAAGLGPLGLAMGSNGNIYVAAGDGAVRMLQPVGPLAAANSASGATGSLAPGEIVTLYGSGIGPDQLVQATPGADGLYDPQLAGTVVTINGIAAPLLYAWTTQTAAIVPYGVTGPSAWATVTYNGMPAGTLTVPVAASAPGVFTADSSGQGQAAALNQDTTPNSATTPAKIGDVITLFATGEGQTSPPGVDGKPATGTLPQPVLPVTVTIGGQTAHVAYAGGAPNEVAGVMQLNVQIPSGIQTGDAVPVILWVGYAASQSGVTVAIR